MSSSKTFPEWFRTLAGFAPHSWQRTLGEEASLQDRLIRIPTGFGKTLGVVAAWTYHRLAREDETWSRRLVWCLPMRVLVEQTEFEVRSALERLGMLWDGTSPHKGKVGVDLLMGGSDAADWYLHPEHCAVLIGTQDMLLSRVLNRGYGAARGRWPMDFGLLNQDCLWVMDEVQLMDVGLATSGQIQAFRNLDRGAGMGIRPCHTWWMSATLQRTWLARSPETQEMVESLPQSDVPPAGRTGRLWDDVNKPVRLEATANPNAVAALVARAHLGGGKGQSGPTLAILNTVDAALSVHSALCKEKALASTDLRLVHSRFRPHERAAWREEFLNRAACGPSTDRIIVATQVVEAGVDISAGSLITQLAPWPSLVQRFGRAARWGGTSQVIVGDFEPNDDKAAAPYTKATVDAARQALSRLADVAPLQLETFEEANPELLPALYPYAPRHLLLRHELEDLFDTTPDLSGADVDVSRFIRSGEERDLQVFWQEVGKDSVPDRRLRPSRESLCAVPFLKARDWLCGKETASSRALRVKADMRAWVWNFLDGEWRPAERRDLYPGQTVLVAADCGGYDRSTGWNPASKESVQPVAPAEVSEEEQADAAQDDETLSAFAWQTIAVHGREVGREAATIAGVLSPQRLGLFELAGRWHDAGKAHEAFNNSIRADFPGRPSRNDLAKAPKDAWLPPHKLYPDNQGRRRGAFRHELASTLALFAVLGRYHPDHPALIGPWRDLLQAAGTPAAVDSRADALPSSLEQEVLELTPDDFDLVAYLVCAHHGKVRVAWHAAPADQQAADTVLRIRGIRDGEELPPVLLATAEESFAELPISLLRLNAAGAGLNPVTGRGWTERVLGLLERHGPFSLAYMEAMLRAADQRASRTLVVDPLLSELSAKESVA